MSVPEGIAPLVGFPPLLRAHGFAVAPDQTIGFVAAVGLLGPRHMEDIRRAAVALLAPPPERRAEFDALFARHFLGRTLAVPLPSDAPGEETRVEEDGAGWTEPPEPEAANEAGLEAARAEILGLRGFAAVPEAGALRRLRREAPARLPRRRARRLRPGRGRTVDARRALREAARRGGEVLTLPRRKRVTRQRRLLLLIDVSGSMKDRTDTHLRLAHALLRAAEAGECFTLGTRLTRVSRALRLRHPDQALRAAAALVADWDGGTRLGDALGAFLAVPRFAGFARGAAVVVLSDGLERGDPAALVAATQRLARLAWRLVWLTPLASDPAFRPETGALGAMLPHLHRLGSAASAAAIVDEVLALEDPR